MVHCILSSYGLRQYRSARWPIVHDGAVVEVGNRVFKEIN